MSEKSLTPIEERTVDFYGDELKGVRVTRTPSGRSDVYVPLRPLCDYLGVSYNGQRERILRDPVLSTKLQAIPISTAGGPQEMQCIPLDYLNGWLFGINANRVKEEIRQRVIRYQEECYQILRAAFLEPAQADALTQVEQLGHALITLAREQREFDARLDKTTQQLDEVTTRVVAIEERLDPGNPVTEEQAAHISQAVRAIAYRIGERTGRNEYGGVYSQLYSKFSVTSYKLIPADKYPAAMKFLSDWWANLTDEEVPF